MPKQSKRPKAQVVPAETREKLEAPVFRPLVMEERDRLSVLLNDPVFIKAWNNAEAVAPPLFPTTAGQFDGQFGDANAAKALARKQGWEMHKAALLKQTKEVQQKNPAAQQEYPDSGTLEAEIKSHLPKSK